MVTKILFNTFFLHSQKMGLSVSSLLGSLSSLLNWSKDKDVRILMLGLDSAGKVSTILYDVYGENGYVELGCIMQTTILYRLQVIMRQFYGLSLITGLIERLAKSFRQYPVSKSINLAIA